MIYILYITKFIKIINRMFLPVMAVVGVVVLVVNAPLVVGLVVVDVISNQYILKTEIFIPNYRVTKMCELAGNRPRCIVTRLYCPVGYRL